MTGHITRRRLVYLAIAVFVVLAILSFVLPFAGSGHGRITTIP
jgi:hypothetical protein